MLRYKTETRPGLVALYDIRPGNEAGQQYSSNLLRLPTAVSSTALVQTGVYHVMQTRWLTTRSTIWFTVAVQTNMHYKIIYRSGTNTIIRQAVQLF